MTSLPTEGVKIRRIAHRMSRRLPGTASAVAICSKPRGMVEVQQPIEPRTVPPAAVPSGDLTAAP
jgi:hypothetical protein